MTNKTYWKYVNIYTANRNKNNLFDRWILDNYSVIVGKEVWDYGSETFIDKKTGEEFYTEAPVMQKYVKSKLPYFKDLGEWYDFCDSDYPDVESYFNSRLMRR